MAGGRAVVQVRELAPGEVERAADILGRAFADESLHRYLLGSLSVEQRARVLRRYFQTILRFPRPPAIVHAVELEGALVGVRLMAPSDAPAEAPLDRLRRRVAFARVVLRAPGYLRARKLAPPPVPAGLNWYMEWAAIDPAVQGSGAASALFDQGAAFLDDRGATCTFATCTRIVKESCERRGWVVTEERQSLPGGPTEWLMLREAQSR